MNALKLDWNSYWTKSARPFQREAITRVCKFVAEQLMLCARAGKTSLEELAYAGQRALVQLRRVASSARSDGLIEAG